MDQLRKAWGWLQRQHFWVLTVIAILVALGLLVARWRARCWTEYTDEQEQDRIRIQQRRHGEVASRSTPTIKCRPPKPKKSPSNRRASSPSGSSSTIGKRPSVLKWPSNLSEEFRDHIEKLNFGDDIPREFAAALQQLHPRSFSGAAEDRRRARRAGHRTRRYGWRWAAAAAAAASTFRAFCRAGSNSRPWRPEGRRRPGVRRARFPRDLGRSANDPRRARPRDRRPRRNASGRRKKMCGSTKRCSRSSPTRTKRPAPIGFPTRRFA